MMLNDDWGEIILGWIIIILVIWTLFTYKGNGCTCHSGTMDCSYICGEE